MAVTINQSQYGKIWRLLRTARRLSGKIEICRGEILGLLGIPDELDGDADWLDEAIFNGRPLQPALRHIGVRVELDPPHLKPEV